MDSAAAAAGPEAERENGPAWGGCRPGGRLDMSHGFVRHIRRNQIARYRLLPGGSRVPALAQIANWGEISGAGGCSGEPTGDNGSTRLLWS